MSGAKQVTARHHSVRSGVIATGRGEMRYQDWLEEEASRLRASGRWRDVRVARGETGRPEIFGEYVGPLGVEEATA